jgi:membrane protein
MKNPLAPVQKAVKSRREAWPWFDHLFRAGGRYKADGGNRLAAALTMYAVFALLPLLLLAISALGYVLHNDPEAQAKLFTKITSALPGVGSQLAVAMGTVEEKRASTGVFGLAGLLFSGLGGIDALRDSLRLMWHQDIDAGGFVKKKITDVLTIVLLAVTLGVSFGISALATGGVGALLDAVGIDGTVSEVALSVLTFVIGVGIDAAMFLVLFKWLPRVDWPWKRLVRGAVFGGFGFGLLKLAGGWYVGRTATKSTALYGSIGTAVAILVGLYLVSRMIMFTAAWTVTAPGWDDVEPSGTASEKAAAEAGVPAHAVSNSDPDGSPRTEPVPEDGTPTHGSGERGKDAWRRVADNRGPIPVADSGADEPDETDPLRHGAGKRPAWAGKEGRDAADDREGAAPKGAAVSRGGTRAGTVPPGTSDAARTRLTAGPSKQSQERVVLAARVIQGFAGTVVALVGLQGIRALRRG